MEGSEPVSVATLQKNSHFIGIQNINEKDFLNSIQPKTAIQYVVTSISYSASENVTEM